MSDNKKTTNGFGNAFDTELPFPDDKEESKFLGDFDEFLRSMGIEPLASNKTQKAEAESDIISEAPISEESVKATKSTGKKTAFDDEVVYAQNEEAIRNNSEDRLSFLNKFRVLQEEASTEEAIYEPTTESTSDGVSFADSLDADEDEDIFDAAEKAGTKKQKQGVFNAEGKSVNSMKKKAKKKKQEELVLSASALRKKLAKSLKIQKLQLTALYIMSFITLILYVLPKLYSKDNPLEILFANGALVYGVINLVCLAVSCIAAIDRFVSAVKSFRYMSPNSDTALFIVCLFVFIHNIYTITAGISGFGNGILFNLYAILAILVSVISERLKCKMLYKNISIFSSSTSLDTINPVTDASDSAVLAKGIAKKGEEKILYTARANTIDSLCCDMGQRNSDAKFYSIVYMAVLAASVFCGIVAFVRGSTVQSFFLSFVACACLCGPNLCEISRTLLLYKKNQFLNSDGAGILNFQSVEDIGKSDAVIMDVSDIFEAEVTRFKSAGGARISRNESAVLAVSALKAAKSLIYHAFKEVEDSLSELPVAEFAKLEVGAGYVSKVLGREVLIGNRNLLKKYKVSAPSEIEEKAFGKGKTVFYVVVDRNISAIFLVDYNVRESIKRASALFNKTGMLLLLTSKEPTLREKLISAKLNLDVSSIKMLSSDSASLMAEYRQNKNMRCKSGLVSVAKRKNAFMLASVAHRLFDADRMLLYFNIALQIVFFALLLVAVFINVSSVFNPISIIVIHAICALLCTFIAISKK